MVIRFSSKKAILYTTCFLYFSISNISRMFELLGMRGEEIDAKFGFLVDAYHYAAPPHGGMGIGLDRLAMLICGTDSLRDVVAFPKVQNASEPMSGAPSFIDEAQLEELSIAITASEAEEV